MSVPGQAREYRVSGSVFATVALSALVGVATLVTAVVFDDGFGAAKPWVVLLVVLPIALLLLRVRSSATVVTAEHLVLRGVFRTRTIPWSDVQDLRIEVNPGAAVSRRAPREVVAAYDSQGGRTILPHVNAVTLADRGLTLGSEVEAFRRTWQHRRGPGWRPSPGRRTWVAAGERQSQTLLLAIATAAFAMLATMVLLLVGLFSGASQSSAPLGWLFHPALVLVLPAIAVAAVLLVTALRRRR